MDTKALDGRYVNLFDPELTVRHKIPVTAGARFFLLDLAAAPGRQPRILASAGKTLVLEQSDKRIRACVEGVARTPGILLINSPHPPRTITLEGKPLDSCAYSGIEHLLWIRFVNQSQPRELMVEF